MDKQSGGEHIAGAEGKLSDVAVPSRSPPPHRPPPAIALTPSVKSKVVLVLVLVAGVGRSGCEISAGEMIPC